MKVGDRVKILNNISTVDGTLYKDSIVKIDEINQGDNRKLFRVVDSVGKIWFVYSHDVKYL